MREAEWEKYGDNDRDDEWKRKKERDTQSMIVIEHNK